MKGWKAEELEVGKQVQMAAKLGLVKYVCPVCGAHLRQTNKDEDSYTCLLNCNHEQATS